MQTTNLRAVAGRALATLGTIAAIAAAGAAPALSDDVVPPGGDRIFAGSLEAGYRTTTEDASPKLFPYDPLGDGPVLGLDLLYLTPGFGTLQLGAGYQDEQTWRADVEYNHGADFRLDVGSRSITHDNEHLGTVPTLDVPAGSYDPVELEGADADPGADYRDERRETTAAVKVRVPGYPAHLRAGGRINERHGSEQMRYFYRSCSTHVCHMNSRSRELDQETREYTLGLDAHAGPVDLAYTHTAQTFQDDAPDPVDAVGNMSNGLPAGEYEHDVNPDQRSFSDSLSLNTNLTNRVVLSLAYTGGEQENEDSDVSRRTDNAGSTLSWRVGPSAFLVGRYRFEQERSADLGAEARALRERNNAAHASGTTTHQHEVEPERTRHTGELAARFSPVAKSEVGARLLYRTDRRDALLEKEDGVFVDDGETTRTTLVGLDGRYRPARSVALEAALGREWTTDPFYAIETTGVTRYEIGGTWTPSPQFLARAAWQGFRGKNDDAEALQRAYAGDPELTDPERTVNGDAFSLMAAFTPAPEFNLTASWSLADNGVDQDMIFGSVANDGYSYLSPDTAWSGRSQMANLHARWAVTRRLTLTAEGTWIDSLESYAPNFEEDDGLEDASRVEFTKLLASLEAQLRLSERLDLVLSAFWADYDDRSDEDSDERVEGLLASIGYRW